MSSTLQMLDVAIGIVFTFLLLSLICTGLAEIVEKYLRFRAKDLERGIRELLNDPINRSEEIKKAEKQLETAKKEAEGKSGAEKEQKDREVKDAQTNLDELKNTAETGIVAALYKHSLISGLYKGNYKPRGRDIPAYIPASNFALALLDLVLPASEQSLSGSVGGGKPAPGTDGQGKPVPPVKSLESLRQAILSNSSGVLTNPTLKQGLLTLVDSAGNDIDKARKNIEDWFNTSMDRVSGWYKSRTQGILVFMGLLLAIAMNADTIAIYKGLQNDPPLRDALVAASQEYAKGSSSTAKDSAEDRVDKNAIKLYNLRLPIGWDWDTALYSKKDTSKEIATNTDSGSVAKESPKKAKADSLKTKIDSLTKVVADSSKAGVRKTFIDSAKKQIDSLKKAAAKQNTTAPAPRQITRQEYLSNRKLALPWYYEKGEGASFWEILCTRGFWLKFIGWFITALAVSLGAPFWFDTLNKIMVIRSTVKPHEKSPEEGSEDRQIKTKS